MAQRVVTAMALLATLAAAVAVGWFVYQTPGAIADGAEPARIEPLPSGGDAVVYTIEGGASANAIGADLEAQGVIRSARHFEVLVGLTGLQNALEAGEYEFERGMPAITVVRRIASGRTVSQQVTFPEGTRVEEMAQLLDTEGVVTVEAFMAALVKSQYDFPFLQQFDAESLQGYVFPAGYEFARETTAEQVVATMLLGFQDNVADVIQLEGQALTLPEVITLAAIVEREAVAAEERPIIAGVFLNRLRSGIPLQADPTVQYAVAQDPASVEQYGYWKQGLTLDDLKIDSPYNTYVYAGLPPGPIANPGFDSIQAVVRPAVTEFLFFVSKNDGTHVFAETLEEHLANVEIYQ